MNRRGFLGGILAACAAPAIVRSQNIMRVFAPVESGLLLPVAGLLTIDMITRETLRILHEKLSLVSSVNNQFDASFANPGVIRVRAPLQYAAR